MLPSRPRRSRILGQVPSHRRIDRWPTSHHRTSRAIALSHRVRCVEQIRGPSGSPDESAVACDDVASLSEASLTDIATPRTRSSKSIEYPPCDQRIRSRRAPANTAVANMVGRELRRAQVSSTKQRPGSSRHRSDRHARSSVDSADQPALAIRRKGESLRRMSSRRSIGTIVQDLPSTSLIPAGDAIAEHVVDGDPRAPRMQRRFRPRSARRSIG